METSIRLSRTDTQNPTISKAIQSLAHLTKPSTLTIKRPNTQHDTFNGWVHVTANTRNYAKEFFLTLKATVRDMQAALRRLETLEMSSGVNTHERVKSSIVGDSVASKAISIAAQQDYIHRLEQNYQKTLDSGASVINRVGSALSQEHALVLQMRYIQLLGWKQIADTAHISLRTAHRLHAECLDWVNEIGLYRAINGFDTPGAKTSTDDI